MSGPMTIRAFRGGWARAGIAAAAYAFVLQVLLLSLGGALHAGAVSLPQAIFCVPDAGPAPASRPAGAHDGLCCVAGCHGPSPARPPLLVSVEGLAPPSAAMAFSGWPSLPRVASNVLPVGSRAPPRLG